MARWWILLVCVFFSVNIQAEEKENQEPDPKLASRITYQLSDGGFGSHLMAYMHAKWMSHVNKIPLLYKPFPYANQLELHNAAQRYDESRKKAWDNTVVIAHESDVQFMDSSKTLYVVPYFKEPVDEHVVRKDKTRFDVGWDDPDFKKILQEDCTPINEVDSIKIPRGYISIAVHVRKPQGTETTETRKEILLKFPSEMFYVKQIRRLYNTFQGLPLFVYVFTNDPNPAVIANKIERELELPDITFSCRSSGNHAKTAVLEDFINMSKFDCLIRPESSFSMAAEAIGHHRIVIKPISGHWSEHYKGVVIDKIHVKVNKPKPKKKKTEEKPQSIQLEKVY